VTISSPACSSAREWTTALAGQQVVLDPTGYPACLSIDEPLRFRFALCSAFGISLGTLCLADVICHHRAS
jgi:hypothetical protein